jgi:hypothetical protein
MRVERGQPCNPVRAHRQSWHLQDLWIANKGSTKHTMGISENIDERR